MRTEINSFPALVPFTCFEHSWPCESVCASRRKSKINKSYRGEKRVLFISPTELFYHTDSHGQLGLVEVSRTPSANSQRVFAGDFQA